ncbi:hypothetical protein VTN00DRAFT_8472 [Thermoascus crustaceus]|uniref:uncharacterized protein n=1 Tax=Thermoascus crustaceus TaxID=5088 RepID=UPI0037423583
MGGSVVLGGNRRYRCYTGDEKRKIDYRSSFIAPGEQICALQYRKLRHRWFFQPRLGKDLSIKKHTLCSLRSVSRMEKTTLLR